MDHHVVAHGDVVDAPSNGVHDAGRVAASDVEVIGLAELGVRPGDVDGDTPSGPDVVVVDARCHHEDHGLPRLRLGYLDLLDLEGDGRLAVALGPDHLSQHARRHLAQGRDLADLVQVLGHSVPCAPARPGSAVSTAKLNLPPGRYCKTGPLVRRHRAALTGQLSARGHHRQ